MSRFRTLFVLGLGAAFLGLAVDAHAISAWARKYDLACTACHWGAYRLNREGLKFQRYGHFNPGDTASKSPADYIAFNSKIRFNDGNDKDSKDNKIGATTFEFHAFALYSGGLIANRFSYFTEIYLHEREGDPNSVTNFKDGGRTKLAEAYLQYTKGDADKYWSIRGGQIASQLWSAHGAGARVSETRNYLVNNATVKTNAGLSNTWLPRARDYGVEFNAHAKEAHLAVGVVNGNGNSPTNVVEAKGNGAKDFYTSFDYTMKEKANIGVFYHNGNLEDPTLATENKDNFYRLGLTFDTNPTDRIWLLASYLNGKDTDDLPKSGLNDDVKSKGFAFEGDFILNTEHWITPFVKYDWFTQDAGSGVAGDFDTTTNMFVVGSSVSLFEDNRGRITAEWQYLNTKQEGPGVSTDTVKDQNFRVELSFML